MNSWPHEGPGRRHLDDQLRVRRRPRPQAIKRDQAYYWAWIKIVSAMSVILWGVLFAYLGGAL
jgi:hypothetical protein